ncbi:MAG: glycosyltransferase [Alphaproteobacteria bacterium]|jgi:spore maturation protein CgeB
MRIAFVGYAVPGSRTRQRLRALIELGHDVSLIDTAPPGRSYESRPSLEARIRHRLRRPADETNANRAVLEAAGTADLIWVENASMIRPSILRRIRDGERRPRLVWYSEDDMMRPRNTSVWLDSAWPLFDLCVTTKSFNANPEELPARGAKRVLFVNNCFDPEIHRPLEPSLEIVDRYGASVGFIGSYEAPRARSLLHLAANDVSVRVWGNGWSRMSGAHPNLWIGGRPLYDDAYAEAIAAITVNLGFLRQANRDRQTTRSIEIPACAGFMLHQYSEEMAKLLKPEREAVYFRDDDELLRSCRQWLNDAEKRDAVRWAGHKRVTQLGLRHVDMLTQAISAAG